MSQPTDHNILLGVLALQADLIELGQFVEACTLWAARKNVPLANILVEKGWIAANDKSHLDYLLERKLQKYGGDPRLAVAAAPDDVKRSLAALNDTDIQRSLGEIASAANSSIEATVDYIPEQHASERYTTIRLHARGGVGQVWLARDNILGRNIALKELRPESAESPAARSRFLKEARITSQLEHPGIVPIYELALPPAEQNTFYTMRLVDGRTLTEVAREYHQRLRAGQAQPIELLALLNAFVTVCHTVAYAHSRGVIHRDLKGQNVILGNFGEVVVLDWGLAKVMESDLGETDLRAIDRPADVDGTFTLQGQLIGTPAYMAPEQATSDFDVIGHQTDIYGLGAVLYEILTGQPPFSGRDVNEVLRKVRDEFPLPPCQICSDVPASLELICLRALAKDPADRQATANDLAQEVQRWLAQLAQRKQEEQERERFFRLSLDLLCIAGFDGYFKQLNPAWEKTLGWTIVELRAAPWIEFVHPDDVEPTLAAMKVIAAGDVLLSHENRYRCKDGSYRWLHWNAREIVGQEIVYAVARDVTNRKHTEELLQEANQELVNLRQRLQQRLN